MHPRRSFPVRCVSATIQDDPRRLSQILQDQRSVRRLRPDFNVPNGYVVRVHVQGDRAVVRDGTADDHLGCRWAVGKGTKVEGRAGIAGSREIVGPIPGNDRV
jgi:uncharacterized protein YodC (DUF2158 family)